MVLVIEGGFTPFIILKFTNHIVIALLEVVDHSMISFIVRIIRFQLFQLVLLMKKKMATMNL